MLLTGSTGLARRALAEAVGSALLTAAVVGSGIAAQRLSPHDVGLQLLESAVATGAGLAAIIVAVGPVSKAHLNPAVSLADWLLGGLSTRELGTYTAAQVSGGLVGCALANAMFAVALTPASTVRATPSL
ncbi:MAG: aquaporin, partial [Egibacteraceae bacterium]